MKMMGWDVGREAWKWRRRLFAWEDELVMECVERLAIVTLQVDMEDRWIWKLHSSNGYMVKSTHGFESFIQPKVIRSKVLMKIWLQLMLILMWVSIMCCGWKWFRLILIFWFGDYCWTGSQPRISWWGVGFWLYMIIDHLFVTCEVFGTMWFSISGWLDISTVFSWKHPGSSVAVWRFRWVL